MTQTARIVIWLGHMYNFDAERSFLKYSAVTDATSYNPFGRRTLYMYMLGFLWSPYGRLISAVAEWMSAILAHVVWP